MSRAFIAGFLFGLLTLLGCATTVMFPYKYYAAHIPDRTITEADVGKSLADLAYAEGILWGKAGSEGWSDLALNECKPDPIPSPDASPTPGPSPKLMKCTTMLNDEFYALKADDEKCHVDLQICQKGNAPTP